MLHKFQEFGVAHGDMLLLLLFVLTLGLFLAHAMLKIAATSDNKWTAISVLIFNLIIQITHLLVIVFCVLTANLALITFAFVGMYLVGKTK